jgi:hypothetical protein
MKPLQHARITAYRHGGAATPPWGSLIALR